MIGVDTNNIPPNISKNRSDATNDYVSPSYISMNISVTGILSSVTATNVHYCSIIDVNIFSPVSTKTKSQ